MPENQNTAVISADTTLEGEIRNAAVLEVFGHVRGTVVADRLIVHQGGRVFGTIITRSAEIAGNIEGHVTVKELFSLRSSGQAQGNIRYGRLGVQEGAVLVADVSNVPPELAGDLQLVVRKGATVRVTTTDLTAIDPDDEAQNLNFTVSHPQNGFVALAHAPSTPVQSFTQAELQDGKVVFAHDGTETPTASFSVVVADVQGATSGGEKTVQVAVQA